MEQSFESQPATFSLIEHLRQGHNNENNVSDPGVPELNNSSTQAQEHRAKFQLPTQLRNTLAAIGLACSEDYDYIGTSTKIFYGRGESTGVLWPIPLIGVSEISDPDEDGCGDEAGLNGLLPRGIAYRSGPTTEMISRRWHQTPVTIRRMRDNQPPDVLLEELKKLSRLKHPRLIMLMAVSATEHWERVQLVYEPIYHGSLHHRLHIMGSSIPLIERLLVLQQICDALRFLHSQKLLHCSVSSHAVHLVSTGQAKLGCLETMTEDNSLSKRAYRKVPSSHWEWMAPWLAPECARGEFPSTLSDVYSFCCLVWETCSEKIPWSPLDSNEINRMWQMESCNNPRMLQLGSDIPLHVTSFLKLGLQPESSERREIDLQEIYLTLRIQAATESRPQQKEVYQKSSPPPVRINSPTPVPPTFTHSQIQPQHGLDAVKENFKEKRTLSPPPPPPGQQHILEGSSDSLEHCNAEMNQSIPNENVQGQVPIVCNVHLEQFPTRNPSGGVRIAIKPASHTTERHFEQMSHPDRNTSTYTPPPIVAVSRRKRDSYHGLNNEIHEAAAEAAKMYRQASEFETLRPMMDEANEDENAAEESTVEVTGHPSLTSTQRHLHGVSYLACSSGLEDPEIGCRSDDIGGAKPKRSRVRIDSPTPVPPTFTHSQIQPQHGWDAVKENFKKRRTLSPPPPPPPGQQYILEKTSDSLDDCNEGNGRSNSRVDNAGGGQNTDRIDGDCESSDFVAVSADDETSTEEVFHTPP